MTELTKLTLSAESPLQDDVRALIAELNGVLLALTPPEFCFHMTAEDMAGPDTTVFVARDDGAAVACGALCRHGQGVGEIKRMYTRPAYQGRGRDSRSRRASPASCWKPGIATRQPGASMSAEVLPAAG